MWLGKNSDDVFLASSHLAGLVKTSLHQSGLWQTSLVSSQGGVPWDVGTDTRHLDRWAEPEPLAPGITHAFMVIMPASQLLAWTDAGRGGGARLMMEPTGALSVEVLILRPTHIPTVLRSPDSVIFGEFSLSGGAEVVLLSRKLPWTDDDEARLEAMKALRRPQSTYNDPRPLRPSPPGTLHMTRVTMFGGDNTGRRFVIDAYDPEPFPGRE